MLTCLLAATLAQVDLTGLLQRGPLVLVEEGKGSKFGLATTIVLIDAPPELVWGLVQKVDEFKSYMPKVTTSDVVRKGEADFDVRIVLDVPGPDTDYTVRYTPDQASRTMNGVWQAGDLKGSTWAWKVEAGPAGKTLLSHSLAVKNFSGLAQSFDDDQQTITVGVNVSSALAGAKAVKLRAESQAKAPAAPAVKAPTAGK